MIDIPCIKLYNIPRRVVLIMNLYYLLLIYLLLINLYGFIIMYLDKERSKKKRWRIPEKRFFIVSLFLGSLGTYLGMITFHHKTKHWYFKYGIPMIILLQALVLYYVNK